MDTYLDLFSTSQKEMCFSSPDEEAAKRKPCIYRAPLFWYRKEHTLAAHVVQGSCHHWDCPRCGVGRAKQEYARIVNGIPLLARSQDLWFMTLTCKGGTYTVREATQQFGAMWNRLRAALAYDWRRQGGGDDWHYVAITEKQRRGHPHLHIVTTYAPSDRVEGAKRRYTLVNGVKRWQWVDSWYSMYLTQRVVEAGFGEQFDFQPVRTAQGISHYLAKYLFKPEAFLDVYPPKWKRVRYSQKFPKLPEVKTDCHKLITSDDWRNLAQQCVTVFAHGDYVASECRYWLNGSNMLMQVVD